VITLNSADRSAIESRVKQFVRYFAISKDMTSLEKKYFSLRVPLEQAWYVSRVNNEDYVTRDHDFTVYSEEQMRNFVAGSSFPRDVITIYMRFICSLPDSDVSALEASEWKIINPVVMSQWFTRSISGSVRQFIRNQIPVIGRSDLGNSVNTINRIMSGNVGVMRQGSLSELIDFVESRLSDLNAYCHNCSLKAIPPQIGVCSICGYVQSQPQPQQKKRGV